MELFEFLRDVTAIPGLPGMERPVAEFIAKAFEDYADDVMIDARNNVIATSGSFGPRIMLCAHLDEIGLVVTKIEEDGCLRIARNGGVDPRILPGLEVSVSTKDGPLFGVVGAKPPHLLSPADQKKMTPIQDLYVDIGFSADEVKKRVRIGDAITLAHNTIHLAGERVASKTLDDRACVAVMLLCAEHLKHMQVNAQVQFVASSQEEIGGGGAKTAANRADPDIAIALDVAHGKSPGTGEYEAYPLEQLVITAGPVLHPALVERLKKTADSNGISYAVQISGGHTYTDADQFYNARAGIPSLLLATPVRYMHTTVETIDLKSVREAARLLALFILDISREWEGFSWC